MRSSPFVRTVSLVAWALVVVLTALAGQAAAQTQDHQYSTADIETGSRLYGSQCALCHGQNGDGVSGVNLRRQQFRRVSSDQDIRTVVTTGVAASGMPSFKLAASELDGLVAFIRAGFDVSGTAVKIGTASRGQAVFEGKGGCTFCHRVNGKGPRVAPDLSDIGAVRQPAALQRSLLDPTGAMIPINRPVRIVTRDGRTIRGRRFNEDTAMVLLIDEQERLVALPKTAIREYVLGTTSEMPSVAGKLTDEELADVLAYLLSLKGL